ncbi:DUF6691 family protein [Halioglobus sp. Uisw_031]|jgi:uncharacterized membrane protein YedE/YeeE|uniref:DUF6691 family protein n=1 Tax=Halioglobus sp. Uisw_031 TaxID=3230977 RepID=UPI0039ED1E67
MRNVIALLCGLVFGAGLAVSGMTDTAKVLGFLDVLGNWTPDLAFVIGAAACVILMTFPFVMRRKSPLMSLRFLLPTTKFINGELVGGAALYGIGWGLYGYFPGSAMSSLLYQDWKTAIFVVAMLIGMALANKVSAN